MTKTQIWYGLVTIAIAFAAGRGFAALWPEYTACLVGC